jgi:hypothetical protein
VFLQAVNERSLEFEEVRRLLYEIVKFVCCWHVLDVMDDVFQDLNAECARSQFFIKSRVDDMLENGDDSSELVCVRDDLGNCSIDAEVKSRLDLELLDSISNVFDLTGGGAVRAV